MTSVLRGIDEVYRLFGFDPEQGASAKEIQSRIPAEDLQMLGDVVRKAGVKAD